MTVIRQRYILIVLDWFFTWLLPKLLCWVTEYWMVRSLFLLIETYFVLESYLHHIYFILILALSDVAFMREAEIDVDWCGRKVFVYVFRAFELSQILKNFWGASDMFSNFYHFEFFQQCVECVTVKRVCVCVCAGLALCTAALWSPAAVRLLSNAVIKTSPVTVKKTLSLTLPSH